MSGWDTADVAPSNGDYSGNGESVCFGPTLETIGYAAKPRKYDLTAAINPGPPRSKDPMFNRSVSVPLVHRDPNEFDKTVIEKLSGIKFPNRNPGEPENKSAGVQMIDTTVPSTDKCKLLCDESAKGSRPSTPLNAAATPFEPGTSPSDSSPTFAASIRTISAHASPRSAYTTRRVPTHGVGETASTHDVGSITLSGLPKAQQDPVGDPKVLEQLRQDFDEIRGWFEKNNALLESISRSRLETHASSEAAQASIEVTRVSSRGPISNLGQDRSPSSQASRTSTPEPVIVTGNDASKVDVFGKPSALSTESPSRSRQPYEPPTDFAKPDLMTCEPLDHPLASVYRPSLDPSQSQVFDLGPVTPTMSPARTNVPLNTPASIKPASTRNTVEITAAPIVTGDPGPMFPFMFRNVQRRWPRNDAELINFSRTWKGDVPTKTLGMRSSAGYPIECVHALIDDLSWNIGQEANAFCGCKQAGLKRAILMRNASAGPGSMSTLSSTPGMRLESNTTWNEASFDAGECC